MKIRLLDALVKAHLVYIDGRQTSVCADDLENPKEVICVTDDGTEDQWLFEPQDAEVVHDTLNKIEDLLGVGKVKAKDDQGEEVEVEMCLIKPMPLVNFMVKD